MAELRRVAPAVDLDTDVVRRMQTAVRGDLTPISSVQETADTPLVDRSDPVAELHRSIERRLQAPLAADPITAIEKLSRLAGPVAFFGTLAVVIYSLAV